MAGQTEISASVVALLVILWIFRRAIRSYRGLIRHNLAPPWALERINVRVAKRRTEGSVRREPPLSPRGYTRDRPVLRMSAPCAAVAGTSAKALIRPLGLKRVITEKTTFFESSCRAYRSHERASKTDRFCRSEVHQPPTTQIRGCCTGKIPARTRFPGIGSTDVCAGDLRLRTHFPRRLAIARPPNLRVQAGRRNPRFF